MKHAGTVLFLLMGIPFIIGAGKGADKKLVDAVVAIVNGEPISLYQITQRSEILKQKYPDAKDIKKMALDDLIDDDIIYSELKIMGVTINKSEVDNAIEQMSEANGVSMSALKQSLENKGIDFHAYADQIKSELAKSRLVGYKFRTEITVTNDDIQRYYSEHKDEFSMVKQADISHILIEVPPDASAEQKKLLLEKADKAVAAIHSGKSFSDVAMQYSDDKMTKNSGGHLGYVDQGTLYPVIDKAIFKARPGGIAGPVRTPIGYEIIMVKGFKSSELLPVKDVKDKIRNDIYSGKLDNALKSWLLTKRQKAIITVYNEFL